MAGPGNKLLLCQVAAWRCCELKVLFLSWFSGYSCRTAIQWIETVFDAASIPEGEGVT